MTFTAAEFRVVPIYRLELAFAPRAWAFANERRAEIDAYFTEIKRQKPALFNGRVLLLYEHAVVDGIFRGVFLATDYASFLAWREWDFPDRTMRNCFGMAALQTADGAFLLGVMNSHTANAGRIYFPGGTPDPSDVVDGRVDLDGSIRRELMEETGLDVAEFDGDPGWYAIFADPRVALIKILRTREDAAMLRERVLGHLASEAQPELADIRIVRGRADLEPRIMPFMTAFLAHIWAVRT